MSKEVVIGIDTSNYTTSLAILGLSGELIGNHKIPLNVGQGERGVRQSDALFMHTKNLPVIFQTAKELLDNFSVVAVGVSEKPRRIEGSYMPCFLAGASAASAAAFASSAPLFCFSHQCGHLMSAIYSCKNSDFLNGEYFGAYHISGGTTDLMRVRFIGDGFDCERVGGTLDLNCGQVVDRVGVMLGLSFPCGAELERLALQNSDKISVNVCVKGLDANFSGAENIAQKMIRDGKSAEYISAFTLEFIYRSIDKMTDAYFSKYGQMPMLFAGGVMSNGIIRKKIESKYNAYFAERALSSDNAVGIAELARLSYLQK